MTDQPGERIARAIEATIPERSSLLLSYRAGLQDAAKIARSHRDDDLTAAVAAADIAERDAWLAVAEAAQAKAVTPSGALSAADKRALPGRIGEAIETAQAAAREHDAAIKAWREGKP